MRKMKTTAPLLMEAMTQRPSHGPLVVIKEGWGKSPVQNPYKTWGTVMGKSPSGKLAVCDIENGHV